MSGSKNRAQVEKLISKEEAFTIIGRTVRDFGDEIIDLSEAVDRILREDWCSDRDLPPYDRVAMDGIAIVYDHFKNGQRAFKIEGVAAAGSPQQRLTDRTSCLEVMTGCMLPANCDTVIRYEDVNIKDGVAYIDIEQIDYQQNIHFKGIDRKAGDVIISAGQHISSAELGLGASRGKSKVKVARFPSVIVVSTGNELVDIDTEPKEFQIRKSNVYRILTTLKSQGIQAHSAHFNDDIDEITTSLRSFVKDYDCIILSGGVSKGKYDYLPQVLNSIGVKKLFHKIAQKPGKPFWFGSYQDHCTVFAFPGNPVSSFLCLQVYFKHWLTLCLEGSTIDQAYAVLAEDVHFAPHLTYFLEVKLKYDSLGYISATPQLGNGSGDLANLVDADAFIELPSDACLFQKGQSFPIYLYRK